jgi:hypothetical protein
MTETINSFDFTERLAMSQGVAANAGIDDVLLKHIPGALRVQQATTFEDRHGTDRWVYRRCAPRLSIDVKSRSMDPTCDLPPEQRCDDLALEVWSVKESQKRGWTWDSEKHTDYILWWFQTTHRWVLIPFPLLCAVATERIQEWNANPDYRTRVQDTNHGAWHSECVYVPRQVIWQAIIDRFGGAPITDSLPCRN